MTRWEYMEIQWGPASKLAAMNKVGKDGWELVSVVFEQTGYGTSRTAYFKRPVATWPAPVNQNEVRASYGFESIYAPGTK